jgi:hypothetical protein
MQTNIAILVTDIITPKFSVVEFRNLVIYHQNKLSVTETREYFNSISPCNVSGSYSPCPDLCPSGTSFPS